MIHDTDILYTKGILKTDKPIVKHGTIAVGVVETTPVVWHGKLLRFEWVRNQRWGLHHNVAANKIGCLRFVDMETNEGTTPFAFDHSFGCCYEENDVMYVVATRGGGGNQVLDLYVSTDLEHWEESTALTFPDTIQVYNTSICKGPDGYIMAIEIGGDHPAVGTAFTIVYAKSADCRHWVMMDMMQYSYDRGRYTACPVIRYYDGFYYMINLEALPGPHYVPYIVRTRDLEHYELGIKNPVFWYDDDDKKIERPAYFTDAEIEEIQNAVDINASDVDFCEYNGKTVILYSWGNQRGLEYLAWAEYDGTPEAWCKSFFESNGKTVL